jgi:hypothetical protein
VGALRIIGLHCALAAMLLRALLPAGWMPNPTASLTVPLVICTMNGPVRAMVTLGERPNKHTFGYEDGPGHGNGPGHDDGRQHGVCPFAGAIQLAVPTSGSTLVPSQATARLAASPLAPRSARHVTPYSLQSPRAPPTAA